MNDFNTEQITLAQTAAQGITSFFNDYQSEITFISELESIKDFDAEGSALFKSYFNNRKNLISAITRVDSNGIIQYTFPYDSLSIGKDISYQKHVELVLKTQKIVISDVFQAVQGYLCIAMHVPIFDKARFIGSIAILIPIDKLGQRYFQKVKIRETGVIWLLSKDLIEIYCPYKEHLGRSYLENCNFEDEAIKFSKVIKKDSSGTIISHHQQVLLKEEEVQKKHMVFYRTPIGNTYWTIIISYEEEDIYSELHQLRNRLILIFSVLFLFILYFFYSSSKIRAFLKEERKRKLAEKILRESEEKYRTMIETSNDFIWMLDLEGKITFINDRAVEQTGLIREEWYGNHFSPLVLAEELAFLQEVVLKNLNGESVNYEFKLKTNHQKLLTLLVNTAPIFSDDQIIGMISFAKDITEHKRQDNIRQIILNISNAANYSKDLGQFVGIIHKELNTSIDASNFYLALYNNSNNEITIPYLKDEFEDDKSFLEGNTLTHYVIKTQLPLLANSQKISQLASDGEIHLFGKTSLIWMGVPVKIDKKVIGVIAVQSYANELAYDDSDLEMLEFISDQISMLIHRKRAEEHLINALMKAEESDRLKSAFLANMSHEIRTPMNGILGFASLLKEPDLTKVEQEEYIKVINRSGTHLLDIINDLIDISKIEAGQIEVMISSFNLNEQMQLLYSFFRKETEKKGMELKLSIPQEHKGTIIQSDKEKLYAILTNLIKNAIKYSDKGIIEFWFQRITLMNNEYFEFHVKDNGIGIPLEKQEHIFDRFIQADADDSRVNEGSGLGLTISKAYVELLGGEMGLHSELGKGSDFFFIIPIS
ncbi:ATP-binding protein [Lentimicrobium sp. L6]|uniref:ATP-binding protein n=1 Tax=Lentimicrobium sp. L6 TaxID=2735916 RepID=UPI003530264E